MKTKEFRLDVKNLAEDGTFEGYGSIFGNVDCYRESVVKGAFSKTLKKHEQDNNPVLMLWQHSWEDPIGVWKELKEDDRGLYGVGEINLDVQKGREAYSLMKQRALTGLSIGYKEVKYTDNAEVRLLEEIDLYEISPVTFPANEEARISTVKSERFQQFAQKMRNGLPPSIKEFEDVLRDAGISKSMATRIASVGYAKAIRSESDSTKKAEEAVAFLKALRG
ncbi:HK97 family phage prohead protease [uncultured Bartonella sp.]|uniref:HK97 family phage prohead protease n=1 Tax=uncultured Bartonella sp. TaxID=104108 RepID=UPI0025F851B5|nr:HK97 family phage prohead protease [uncultured Bartonella sp.]